MSDKNEQSDEELIIQYRAGKENIFVFLVGRHLAIDHLRKAIGAAKKDISLQFLAEAVALTLVVGAIGIVFGWAIVLAVTASGLIKTSVTFTSILLAFGVSAGIGIVFGYYPARRASQLNPIEALRYE